MIWTVNVVAELRLQLLFCAVCLILWASHKQNFNRSQVVGDSCSERMIGTTIDSQAA